MEKYDKDALISDTDIVAVAADMGVDMKRNGRSVMFLCPNPQHNDTHFGSCRLNKDRTRINCYACAKSYNAIDVVMMTSGRKFTEAIEYIASLNGRDPSFYYTPEYREDVESRQRGGSERRRQTTVKKALRLAEGESQLLAIDNGGSISAPVSFSYKKEEDAKGSYWEPRDGMFLKISRIGKITPMDDEEMFSEIVRGKCCEAAYHLSMFINEVRNPSYGVGAVLYAICAAFNMSKVEMASVMDKMLSDVVRTYRRFGGCPDDTVFDMCKRYIVDAAYFGNSP